MDRPPTALQTPRTHVRLNDWPAPDGTGRSVFNLVGELSDEDDGVVNISAGTLAAAPSRDGWRLVRGGRPRVTSKKAVSSASAELDPKALVAILAPRWLAFCEGEDREGGLMLLEEVVKEVGSKQRTETLPRWRRAAQAFEAWGNGVP